MSEKYNELMYNLTFCLPYADAARAALDEYVANLEAEVARLRILYVSDELSSHLLAKYKAQADEIDRKFVILEAENDRLREAVRWRDPRNEKPENNQLVEVLLAGCRNTAGYVYHSELKDDFERRYVGWRPLTPPEEE